MLGELQLGGRGAHCVLPPSRKTRALLAYLAVTARRHLRSELGLLFWDDVADPRAGLRWSLTQLRHALGDAATDLLVADRDSVGLKPGSVRIDLDCVRVLTGAVGRAARALAARPRAELLAASELFRGEFLEGLDLPACYAYHDWCMAEREAASRLHEQILVALLEHDRADPAQVLIHARALTARNPLNERGHFELIRALVALGRRRDAQSQHAQCCRIFEAELGLAPSPALAAALASLGHAESAPAAVSAAASPPAAATAIATTSRWPMVGRTGESVQLATTLARASAGTAAAEVLLISGAPGLGKSRLLDELQRQVEAAGGLALRARAFESERLRPFGIWIDMLHALSASALAPALRDQLAPLLSAGTTSAGRGDRDTLFDAVRDALGKLAHARLLALIVDDLQWIDASSAALLHYVLREPPDCALFALAGRNGELEDNAPAQSLLAALAGEQRLRRIVLAPLDDTDALALLAHVAPGRDVNDRDRIVALAHGHPLMLIELSRPDAGPDASAALIDRLLQTRLSRLTPAACELLEWASAFGRGFALETLLAAQGSGGAAADPLLRELERHELIAACGEEDYGFGHEMIRQAAYGRISHPRRRLIHKAIALATNARLDLDPARALEVAHHAGLGGHPALAAQASARAGEHALRLFANREAAELARRGRDHVARVQPGSQRVELEMALLRIQVLATAAQPLARLRPATASVEQAIAAAQTGGLDALVAQGHYLLSVLHQSAGNVDAARVATLHAAASAGRSDRIGRARQLANSARCLVELGRDIEQARSLADEAQALADGDAQQALELHWCRALLCQWDGDLDDAQREIETAVALASGQQDRWRQRKCLASAAMIALERGASAAALAWSLTLAETAAPPADADDAALANVLAVLARCMRGSDDGDTLSVALSALRSADDKSTLATVLNLAASIACAADDFATALRRADDALAQARVIGADDAAMRAHALIARAAGALGDAPRRALSLQALQPLQQGGRRYSAGTRRAAQEAGQTAAASRGGGDATLHAAAPSPAPSTPASPSPSPPSADRAARSTD